MFAGQRGKDRPRSPAQPLLWESPFPGSAGGTGSPGWAHLGKELQLLREPLGGALGGPGEVVRLDTLRLWGDTPNPSPCLGLNGPESLSRVHRG